AWRWSPSPSPSPSRWIGCRILRWVGSRATGACVTGPGQTINEALFAFGRPDPAIEFNAQPVRFGMEQSSPAPATPAPSRSDPDRAVAQVGRTAVPDTFRSSARQYSKGEAPAQAA